MRATAATIFHRNLARSPVLWARWHRRRAGRNVAQIVQRDSLVLVEGAAGCANTFIREALRRVNPGAHIASHMHRMSHVRRALRLGVPALVPMRPPVDAVTSVVGRELNLEPRTRDILLDNYEDFYQELRPVHDRVMLARFEDSTSRLGDVITAMNQRFGSNVAPYPDGDEQLRQLVNRSIAAWTEHVFGGEVGEHAALPNEQRTARVAELAAQLRAERPDQVRRCEEMHDELAEVAARRLAEHVEMPGA